MTSIDCLLRNTDIVDAAKAVVEYMGVKKANEGKDASLDAIYRELRDNGVEIDLGSAAHIYKDVLSTKGHEAFNTHEEVNDIAGKYFDDLQRGIILREAKTGERQISELSPKEAAVKALVRAFTSPLVKDERTKSILRTMQDAYTAWAKKMAGPLPEAVENKKDTRGFEEIVRDALDKESLGYTDNVTGALNSFTTLHEGAKSLLQKIDKEVAASGDKLLKAQWESYAKSIEDATRSLMLSTAEGKKVLHEALMAGEGGGFVKETRDGNMVLDHRKLAGEVGSIIQYRDNVIKSLTAHGFSPDEAQRTADSLQKEYFELRGKSLELLRNEQLRKEQSYEPREQKEKVPVGDIVREAIKRHEAYQSLTDEAKKEGVDTKKYTPELTFSKNEADRIVLEALKASDDYSKESVATGERAIDWRRLALDPPSEQKLNSLIADHLRTNEKVSGGNAKLVSDNLLQKGAHESLKDDIESHSESTLATQERLISKETAKVNKSEMTRLAELHAMGIFSGAHDELMHNVLGIDNHDQQARRQLIDLFQKQQSLVNLFGGNEFVHHTMTAELQARVNRVIEANIADKGRLSKIAKVIYDYQNFVNMGIIANPFNIAENTVSGFQANLGQTLGIFRQMGLEQGKKIFTEMKRVWWATLRDVAKGGIHYGIESGKFAQSSEAAAKYTLKNWDNLNAVGKAVTMLTAYAHLGLNAMDSAYKTSIHQKTTMLNLHKALMEVRDEFGRKMNREQANDYLNQHLFGQSLEDAKARAEMMYKAMDIPASKDMIERSARELVQANIFSDGRINDDVIQAAVKGAYNVAGVSLGHEARHDVLGFPGKWMKQLQNVGAANYDKLIREGKYDMAAAYHIGVQSMIINGVFKFAHGVTNWMVLRPLTSGLGLVSGRIGKSFLKSDMIDYADRKSMEEAFYKTAQYNADINRAYVGLSMFALQAGAVMLYGALKGTDDEKKKGLLGAGFRETKKNPILNKTMNKIGSDMLSLMYSSYIAKHQSGEMEQTYSNWLGFEKYVENLTNVGQGFSFAERSSKIAEYLYKGGEDNKKKAAGLAGEQIKSFFLPGGLELPFYRSGKQAIYLSKSILEQKAQLPPFYTPKSTAQGIFDNGVFNDIDEILGGHLYHQDKQKIKMETKK